MGEISAVMTSLHAKAKANPQRIAFPEAQNPTVLTAAHRIATDGMGLPVLVGNVEKLQALCEELGFDQSLFEFVDSTDEVYLDELVAKYEGYPTAKLQGAELKATLTSPLWVATLMQAVGDVRISHAGYVSTTADVLRAALKIIRPGDSGLCSSVGMVLVPDNCGKGDKVLFLADISTRPDPTAEELALIAIESCETAYALTGVEPTCAMLSYSTKGSAKSPMVDKVVEGTRLAKEMRPDLKIDGEYQLDAAVNPAIGAKKAGADNPVAGKANVLIFPDLGSANIGVKLLEQFAGGKLYGAILQGFRTTCCDSSRGASIDELVGTILAATVIGTERDTAQK